MNILDIRWSGPGGFYWQTISDPGLLAHTQLGVPLRALFEWLAHPKAYRYGHRHPRISSGPVKVGDVLVVLQPTDNPYTAPLPHLITRQAALRAFRNGDETGGIQFWFAPPGGGARLLTDPYDIDWSGL